MNFGIVRKLVGKIMILMSTMMGLPIIVALCYKEAFINYVAFIIPSIALLVLGLLLNIGKVNSKLQAREGFVIVALGWLVMSLFGSIPLMISGYYKNFFDAFFEISSGFTTTGATITTAEMMDSLLAGGRSILFWRSLSHWVGGMGVLVFILAIIPESNEGSSVHILRAESPGPTVGKLVSKMKASSRILYLIYIALSITEFLFLLLGPNHEMDVFESLVYTFGTAGTGGFGINSISVELYSAYYQYVIASFMVIFGINFTIFYLIIIGKFKDAFKSEEVGWYLVTIFLSVVLISFNIYHIYQNLEMTIRQAFFQTASVISTTGFSTTNFDTWPAFSHGILIILMLTGACAGSTGGGMKFSRVIILIKSTINKIGCMVNPHKVKTVKIDGKPISSDTQSSVQSFFIVFLLVLTVATLLISLDGYDFTTNFTASLACISNIGPGLSKVGPYGNYAIFSNFSKLVLSLEMIAGRLELFPILILFSPSTYKK